MIPPQESPGSPVGGASKAEEEDSSKQNRYKHLTGFFPVATSKGKQNGTTTGSEDAKTTSPPRKPPPQVDDPDQWWNEYPLEGNPNRPAVIFAKMLSKSPRLIGWDDEKWERKAFEIMEKRREIDRLRPPDEVPGEGDVPFPVNDDGKVTIDVDFGFINRVSNSVAERIEKFVKASDMGADEAEKMKSDEDMVKDSELYRTALKALRWQRDSYLVGPTYADRRQVERDNPSLQTGENATPIAPTPDHFNWNDLASLMQKQQQQGTTMTTVSGLPYDASALGNVQLARLGEWFIPSRVVQKALLPMVLGLPRGPLYEPAFKVTTNLIPMSQPTLDRVMKNTVLWILKDPQWRGYIKNSMNGYIATTYRDSPPTAGSNRQQQSANMNSSSQQ